MAHSRRNFLRQAGAGLFGLPLASSVLAAAAPASAAPSDTSRPLRRQAPLSRFPRMMQEWAVSQVRQAEARGDAARAQLRTRADAERYVAQARARIAASFGPLPVRTELKARVVGTIHANGYAVEKILFESRPGFLVTGNLYLPSGPAQPRPTVLGLCGHWEDSKADAANHQSFAQGLVRLGYVCFLIDPVGQGERRQYVDAAGHSPLKFGVWEHLQLGNQQTLVGEFLGAWFVWDAIRALDYLETRPEVDPRRLGATGCSGGGTQTAGLAALDRRLSMIAPACFVTTFRRNTENELPVDPEQAPPRALALSLDHSDFIAAFAPGPALVLAQSQDDIFDVRGAKTAYERLKRLYLLLGVPENISLRIGPDHHGYSQPCREAMYAWFNRAAGLPPPPPEPPIVPFAASELWCAPQGQVAQLHSQTVPEFTRQAAGRLQAARPVLRGEALQGAVRGALRLAPEDRNPPDYALLRGAGPRGYPAPAYCTYAVDSEPGIQVLLTGLFPAAHTSPLPQRAVPAILYISHRSADAELAGEPLVPELAARQPDAAWYACDLRGIGDSQPNTCGVDQFLSPYGSDYFYACHGQLLDRPLVGQRTHDLLRVIALLSAAGHREIHLAGVGWGALPAAFAALLSPAVTRVTLKHALRSYQSVAETASYEWPCALLLPGVLHAFDLPDCYAELATKQLIQTDPWGPEDGLRKLSWE